MVAEPITQIVLEPAGAKSCARSRSTPPEAAKLFYRLLRAIEQALSARREYVTKEGQIIYGGPDHYARLAATKHLRDFLSAGRPVLKQPEKEERRRMTLQEVEELLREDEEAKKRPLSA
jgi:hypothetical protein